MRSGKSREGDGQMGGQIHTLAYLSTDLLSIRLSQSVLCVYVNRTVKGEK